MLRNSQKVRTSVADQAWIWLTDHWYIFLIAGFIWLVVWCVQDCTGAGSKDVFYNGVVTQHYFKEGYYSDDYDANGKWTGQTYHDPEYDLLVNFVDKSERISVTQQKWDKPNGTPVKVCQRIGRSGICWSTTIQ